MTNDYFDDAPDAPSEVERALRSHTTATIQFGGTTENLKYILGPEANPIAPATRNMLTENEIILLIPDQTQIQIEAMVTPFEVSLNSAEADRWRIYHGEPPDRLLAIFVLEAIRYGEHVVDGEAFANQNPLGSAEPSICLEMNKKRISDLRALTYHFANVEVVDPRLVGVDTYGFDIRANLGIIRVPALRPMLNQTTLTETLDEMLEQARAE